MMSDNLPKLALIFCMERAKSKKSISKFRSIFALIEQILTQKSKMSDNRLTFYLNLHIFALDVHVNLDENLNMSLIRASLDLFCKYFELNLQTLTKSKSCPNFNL